MSEREQLLQELMDVIGEEGCGVSCEEATVYKDEEATQTVSRCFQPFIRAPAHHFHAPRRHAGPCLSNKKISLTNTRASSG